MNKKLFIKGPIPVYWVAQANRLGGSVSAIAFSLWLYDGLYKGGAFKIEHRLDDISGVTRQARQRSLLKLKDAGLIELTIRRCASPIVRIIKIPKDEDIGYGGRIL
jgi:hypothetical protein